ncbi:MAG: hypothetical protein ACTS5A_02690 [Candidatus Hodgkinia cicadicola]
MGWGTSGSLALRPRGYICSRRGLEQMNGRSGDNDIGSAAIVAERCWASVLSAWSAADG